MKRFKLSKILGMIIILVLIISLLGISQGWLSAADVARPSGWTDETHGKDAANNYSMVLPDNKVNRIDITISSQNFSTMENDLKTKNMMSTEDPVYVPATVKFNNITWTNVGIRYKGQSTLFTPQQSGKHKYPFRLNFDKYEKDYPEIDNQRFYGFKELAFGNNWYDASLVRDKVTSDLLRKGGVRTARGAFYRVYIDTGSGPEYWGLYTAFEDVSSDFLDSQFDDDKGNLYKGQQGTGADLRSFNKQGYEKKTNEDVDDWTDLQKLVTALNASRTNATTWRQNLEATFDVQNFLKWLAINTAIINFDTYGWVTKNHYFYQNLPDNGKLVYIPWDFNLSLTSDPFGMMGMGGMGGMGSTIPASLSLSEVTNSWPLIRYLIDDPVYKNVYHTEMQKAMSGCFNESTITAEMRRLHEMIRPYVVGSEGEASKYSFLTNGATQFNQGLNELVSHVSSRQTAVRNYLSSVNITPTTTSTQTTTSTPTTTSTRTTIIPSTTTQQTQVSPSPTTSNNTSTGNFVVSYSQNDWGSGATVTITIKNNGTNAVNNWTLAWTFPGNQKITNLWNGSYTQSGASVTVKNAEFNGSIAPGASINFGFNISYSGSNTKPSSCTLNGTTCTIQ